ncbi:hypothetical protein AAF712_013333 [Marasmius tenuissimus]|uniref:F-box domain-containing protein n=1 Tax=Marasmius tenuissimus TaxID=585030 RepID=A0ABR2ZEZ3_9AGAR
MPQNPPHLEDLPVELLTEIFGSLPNDGTRLALASTNSHLRNALAPHVFSAIKIENSTRERHEFEQLANKYGSAITHLHFVASMPHGRPEDDIFTTPTDYRTDEQDTPSPKRTLTMVLMRKLLPNATTLSLSFDFDFEYDGAELDLDDNIWDGPNSITDDSASIYVFADEEAAEDVPIREAEYPWRALMAQAWSAVCQNKFITKLIVLNLIPKKTTTFDSEDWRDFLGRLDTLELRMWGGDNGVGWRVNTLEGYLAYEAKLGEYFFRHLNKVQRLLLAAYPECPFGGLEVDDGPNFNYDIAFPLSKEYLPRLKTLELHNIFISKRLVSFVLNKGTTLLGVYLHHCHANRDHEEGFSWAEFFTCLDSNKSQLRELHITYEGGDLALLSDYEGNQLQKQNEEDRVFSYGNLISKYGDFVAGNRKIREKYEERRDLDAYRSLMDTLGRRKEGDKKPLQERV